MRKTLIVIDMQNDFITGPLGTEEARAIVPKVKKKIEEYDNRGDDRIIFTKDTHESDYLETLEGKHLPIKHCIEDTHGWDLCRDLRIPSKSYIWEKETFGYTEWPHWLVSGDFEIVGVCTDICVISNALILKAMFPESEITVDASCCAGTTPENHKAALAVMKSCHINIIGETDDTIVEKTDDICDCYHKQKESRIDHYEITGRPVYHDVEIGRCFGTLERDECRCGGEKAKCDFYAHVREQANKNEEKEK